MLDRAIIKRIRCHNLGREILRFASFLIAFLNAIINYLKFRWLLYLIFIYNSSPRSPTARVHVAAGGNIIWNLIPLDGQVQRRW